MGHGALPAGALPCDGPFPQGTGHHGGGNPIQGAAVAAIADPITDAGIMVAQNIMNTGTALNEKGICDCIKVLEKLPNMIPMTP